VTDSFDDSRSVERSFTIKKGVANIHKFSYHTPSSRPEPWNF